ncbi:hypothetical protein RND81_14G055200 [Saponaria officinalis]|uniref:Uncharacterized protein n=1 Tax=Saponaria officinalis TaxID=3572 RepID=A0AAW1GNU0_SAPOF
MESAKQKAADATAAAKAGMEKTKATVGEKVDKMKGHDQFDKDVATMKKDERMDEAEIRKQEAHAHNEAQKQANTTARTGHTTTGHTTTGSTF